MRHEHRWLELDQFLQVFFPNQQTANTLTCENIDGFNKKFGLGLVHMHVSPLHFESYCEGYFRFYSVLIFYLRMTGGEVIQFIELMQFIFHET